MNTYQAGIRLLPNAVTVLALCAGLSAVNFALEGRFEYSIAAAFAAALCDALDGGLARLLDASSRIGQELDSLADLVSFGVAPALVLYIWALRGTQLGWIVALIFAVCMALRLARFNTLIDDDSQPPFAKEFFMGVPAPAAALTAGIPLYLFLHFGPGWWSAPITVGLWALFTAGLMVSRVPTLSLKTARVRPQYIAPLLVLVGAAAALLLTAPFLGMAAIGVGYLLLIPYTIYRWKWLERHPEAWGVPVRERRAVARAARSARRLGLRPPLRRRVAGRVAGGYSAVARGMGEMVRRGRPDAPDDRRPGHQDDRRAGHQDDRRAGHQDDRRAGHQEEGQPPHRVRRVPSGNRPRSRGLGLRRR